ncbi:CDP-glycerol glycerophosphotransferase family protein [Cytobacillus kochii]|uniref:CDP-glycerol glycerophosphotransferase family protein n=1 Tax=Cytobacillus kochii TaxID=859143 RepID=UPI002785D850|nr:CDP-glycerol glycerophosphotransferase family protein [Cytobacillus kochii]MDQ0185712.1 CDP-glycerol glycerophosphotransferase [Cytobacillus kochii]MED1604877.1 CDP-glycerol glycerophosphotransferase family protein [Cytobacillus kochii]
MAFKRLKKVFFSKKGKNTGFKKKLNIIQDSMMNITITGELLNGYTVKEVWVKSRERDFSCKLAEMKATNIFSFEFNLFQYKESLTEGIYDFFFLIRVPREQLSEKRFEKISKHEFEEIVEGNQQFIEYLSPIGKYLETICTGLQKVEDTDSSMQLYINKSKILSMAVDSEISIKPIVKLTKIESNSDVFSLEGTLNTKYMEVKSASLLLSGRESGNKINIPVDIKINNEKSYNSSGRHLYDFYASIEFNNYKGMDLVVEDIFDFFFEIDFGNKIEAKTVRLGRPNRKVKRYSKEVNFKEGNNVLVLTPYFTIKHFNLSLQVNKFKEDIFGYLNNVVNFAWLLRPFYKRKDIWIVGERPYKAQDTGYRFFKYMRENHPNKNVYYVIEEDSPERRNVESLGNILIYGSKKHILYTLMASKILGSHHADYLFPMRTEKFKKLVKAKKVFLQHGVIGTKNTKHFYGVNSPSFDTDMFIVSSDYEKNIIVQDFGYSPDTVAVTGLSRFDSLFDNKTKVKRQLLIIPTWREWIVNDEVFFESEYFARYKQLVNHPKLHELSKKYNFDIVLCLHPNMQRFSSFFNDSPIKIVTQGEVDVQDLLKESSLMITDYSSVAFDFSFLEKPIIYYQFDRNRFIGKRPSHLDLDNDLPGDILYDHEEILKTLELYAEKDFKTKPENIIRAKKFLKYKDEKSCERIYKATEKLKHKRKSVKEILYGSEYIRAIYKRFRKGSLYFPIVKVLYKIMKLVLPIDEKLIIFESGLGKQYADSPRYIYEELVKRDKKYKTVWIYNKNKRFMDPSTIKVKRLSIRYYYYLARAKYWINNQNFPTYIKKRTDTIYIQTWHGTPLKRMLFDIETIQGRDDTYLERVHSATKNWDYLISPSQYATNAFRSAFKYEGEVLEIGYPRNDIFYKDSNEKKIATIKRQLNIPNDKKIILYAPTFRDNVTQGTNKFMFELNMDLNRMKQELGDEYILLVRMHVVISNKLTIPSELREFVYNVSNYPEIQELYLISDILMTDYSSVMFDYANTGKPLLFFTYDFEEYKNDVRGFYMDFEKEAPGPFLYNTEDIVQSVKEIQNVHLKYSNKYQQFKDKYCSLEDGNASNKIVNQFFSE